MPYRGSGGADDGSLDQEMLLLYVAVALGVLVAGVGAALLVFVVYP